jgi:hypothetical protein
MSIHFYARIEQLSAPFESCVRKRPRISDCPKPLLLIPPSTRVDGDSTTERLRAKQLSWLERHLDMVEVLGSSSVAPTTGALLLNTLVHGRFIGSTTLVHPSAKHGAL